MSMNLKSLCERISRSDPNMLPEDSSLGQRIMCPEYSLSYEDIKTYPLSKNNRLFALCWVIGANHRLYSTMKPFRPSFCYSCSFLPGDRYIVSGRFRQRILGRDITFEQGDLCLIDKNCLHQDYLEDQNAVILFLGISNEFFEDIMKNHGASDRILSFLQCALLKQKNLLQYLHFKPQTAGTAKLEECLCSLLKELTSYDDFSPVICRGLLMRVFCILSTDYDFSLSGKLRREMNWLVCEEITSYIEAHFKDITIRELCERFHFQEDYFNRLLKQKTGMTYTGYVQNLRLAEAERLLLQTSLSIEQIAGEVGYQNKGYFYRIFSRRHNMTPAKFRKEH